MSRDASVSTAGRFDARRVYTVIVLVPLVYAAIRLLPAVALTALVLLVGAVALVELYRLGLSGELSRPFVAVGLFGFAVLVFGPHVPFLVLPGLLVTLLAALSVPLFFESSLDQGLKHIAVTLFGVLYIGTTMSFLAATRLLPDGEWLIFFLLLVTWTADTGAYYAGTLWGRHRLAPRISPKKSVEGLVGGLFCAITISYLGSGWFLPMLSSVDCAILGLLLTGFGLWGDLAESALKRSVGAKDSGGVLPGHGGMLDRLDSLLFTGPAFYYYVTLLKT
ncbi:MAG TPA: phosphatidate cytidylyltransferase [Nitrospira sp.]|nr:phosphatidate cytidylyltransferase [Nitrospira sp.]